MSRKKSDSYHDYLIASLKDPEEAAMYLEVALEEDPDPILLKKAFVNVLEALGTEQLSPEQLQRQREKIDQVFNQTNSRTMYELIQWLNLLGLKLSVMADEQTKNGSEGSPCLPDLAICEERA